MTSLRYAEMFASTAEMNLGQVRAGYPVAALPLKAAGKTANWLLARGRSLIVDGGKPVTTAAEGASAARTYRYYVNPDGIYGTIVSWVTISSGYIVTTDITGGISRSDLTYQNCNVLVNGDSFTVGQHRTIKQSYANILAGTPGAVNVAVEVPDQPGGGSIVVHGISLFECPLLRLDTESIGCVPPEAKSQIYDGYSSFDSVSGIARAYESLRSTYFKRGALFTWSPGYSYDRSETSYTELFDYPPAIQTRRMYANDTTRNVKVVVYAKVSGGTGNVRITMSSGGTVTFNITSTTGAWTTPTNIAVEVDDPSRWGTDGGIRGGSRDEVTVEYRAAAANTISIEGISIYDEVG